MVRRSIASLLVFSLFFFGSPKRLSIEESKAIGPAVLVAPGVAIGLGELLIGAVALAAAIGVLSNQQKQAYTLELDAAIQSIKDATRRGAEAAQQAVTRALASMAVINGTLGVVSLSCALLKTAATGGSAAKTREARASTVGECDPSLRGSPFDCCPDFMRKFGVDGEKMSPVGRFAYRVRYLGRHSMTNQCCFEWDSLHGRFEVYRRGNHEPVKHMGERACAREQDLDDDICSPNFSDKADLLSSRHAPRNGCP